eukprot:CAMPEP_0175325636 /NCGR_PEP_ID=MMETSP0093-20121207/74114_1 /TAXON_ID=311494 /ORGANISM="Alexandrium monilatum, Strain CCMP3105" /LENGTH=36 /DNA_ID= /DNA_START= /DNA_END= /DNA_ORIENTATION=
MAPVGLSPELPPLLLATGHSAGSPVQLDASDDLKRL